MYIASNVNDRSYFKVDLKSPTIIILLSLCFLYLLQYPLARLFFDQPEAEYELAEWFLAYAFIVYSAIILIIFMRFGASGPKVAILPVPRFFPSRTQRVPLLVVALLVFIFFMWSYIMRDLKIGMTIYAEFDPLPFRITGFLFYGRLIIQPLVLAYIARGYIDSKWKKKVIFVLLVGLGAWAALTSGSRFTGIMFALPLLLLFRGKFRYAVFGLVAAGFVTIATLTRHFYLPFFISEEYIQIYANLEYQENIISGLSTIAVGYLISRTMGIAEVLHTFKFGSISPTFFDSMLAFVSFFFGSQLQFEAASIKNVYGLGDDAFGGFGLGLFPNYWVLLGGNIITYTLGIVVSAYLLGRCHRYLSIGLARFGFADGAALSFIILFVFFFEARSYIFPMIFVVGWFLSRPNAPKLVYTMIPRLHAIHFAPPVPVTNRKRALK